MSVLRGLLILTMLVVVGVAAVLLFRPSPPEAWIAIAIGIAVGIWYVMATEGIRRSIRSLESRIDLSDDELVQQHLADSSVPTPTALEIWHEAAAILKVRPGKLRPTDRFGHEIGAYALTSEALDALEAAAKHRARTLNTSIHLEDVNTLAQYVGRVGALYKAD